MLTQFPPPTWNDKKIKILRIKQLLNRETTRTAAKKLTISVIGICHPELETKPYRTRSENQSQKGHQLLHVAPFVP